MPMNPQSACDKAALLHQRGHLAEAERLYLEILERDPASCRANHLLGILRMQQGRDGEALNLIAAALKIEPDNAEVLTSYGNALKGLGRLAEAGASFDRALEVKSDFGGALYQRALLLQQLNRFEDALASYDRALALPPYFVEALYNRGVMLLVMKRDNDALESFDRALAILPGFSEAWNNRGNALRNLGRYVDSLASYDRALAINSEFPSALYNRGNLLFQEMKRSEEALAAYDNALAIKPDFAEAWNSRGNALLSLGRPAESLASYEKALAIKPDFTDAMSGRAWALLEDFHTEEGVAGFLQLATLVHGTEESPLASKKPFPPYKMRHDQEQHDYQASIKNRFSVKSGYRVAGTAVQPANEVSATEQWRTNKPNIAVIDNFLTPEALEGLRRFCLEAPVWRASYPKGYLGAFPEQGFACPLLGQIAGELRHAFPAIFRSHPLLYMWGFKYDSQRSGIDVHADEAAVNVNFWITPDEANLDPESGGLVIWDVKAPMDWDFTRFNNDAAAIRNMLADNAAKSVTIPYRANRAVIFDSDLFHETDKIRFKDGYLNRRVNITMLYGRRGKHTQH